jgi:hypothetical protein
LEAGETDLEGMWQTLMEAWDEPKAHEQFLQACHAEHKLGLAAAKYREVIDGPRDERKPLAQKRLGVIALLATQVLDSTREEPTRGVPRWVTFLAAAFTASAVGWLIYALMH